MKIIFLASAKADLRWFKRYYTQVFPEGRTKAKKQYDTILKLLKSSPHIGHPNEHHAKLREYAIPHIPFTVIYRVFSDRIEILRVLDQRSSR